MSRRILRVLGTFLFAYAAFIVVLAGCQRQLIYFPSRESEAALLAHASEMGMEAWRNRDGDIIGWREAESNSGEATTAVVVFHGNAGYALHRTYFLSGISPLRRAESIRVHFFEYPGYGARPGRPSETTIKEAARDGMRELIASGYEHIIPVGESLGSGVASHLAAQYPEGVSGLLLITPFTRLADVAKHHYPFLPVGLMLREHYDNLSALEGYSGPVAFLIATRDEVVPAELGRRLHNSYSGPKRLWEQEDRTHNTLDYSPRANWWAEVFEFLAPE